MPLAIREKQTEATVRYQFTFIKTTVIRRTNDNKCWQRRGEKRTLYIVGGNIHCWWGIVIHYGKQRGVSSKKLKIELFYNPAVPLLGIY